MHGLGILAIHGGYPEEAAEIDRGCVDQTPSDRALLEMNKFGFHHGDVGAEIAKRWQLPDTITSAIRFYPFPQRMAAPNLAGVVHCATALAIDLEDQVAFEDWTDQVSDSLLNRLNLTREKLASKLDQWLSYCELTDLMVS
ncbi:MAG: HDOD domain-containing protein [Limnobacter sp.]|nr:HDOD domain-containing protein [Limnobacter sp.]